MRFADVIRSLLAICLALFVELTVVLPAAAAPTPAPATPAPPAAPDAQQTAINSAAELVGLKQENARLREELDRLSADARSAPAIDRENQQLREHIITLEADRGRLTHENQSLSNWRDGLKAGAAIFFFGLVVGVLLGRIRRRAGWSDI